MKNNENLSARPVDDTRTAARKPYSAPAIEWSAPICEHPRPNELCVRRGPGDLGFNEGYDLTLVALWCPDCGSLGNTEGQWQHPATPAPSVRTLQAVPLTLQGQVARWQRIERAALATCMADHEVAHVLDTPSEWTRYDHCRSKLAKALQDLLDVLGGLQ